MSESRSSDKRIYGQGGKLHQSVSGNQRLKSLVEKAQNKMVEKCLRYWMSRFQQYWII